MAYNTRIFITLIWAALFSVSLSDEPVAKPAPADDSMDRVLKTELFALAEQLGDTSEAGQDHAAQLVAAARRIQTESRVSAKSVGRILVLDGWREVLNRWDDLELEIVLLQSGGGTMWTHMMRRNNAETEEFLAGIADRLPLEGSKLDPETTRVIDSLLEGAKKRLVRAKVDAGKAGFKPERQAADLSRRLGEAHDLLKWQFQLAGDAPMTKRLLDRCREAADAWESVNDTEKP